MDIQWFSNRSQNGIATIYENNITLNKQSADYFKTAYNCLLGLDEKNKCVIIKPISKRDVTDFGIKEHELNKLSYKVSYARVSNKKFIRLITDTFNIYFGNRGKKYPTVWDESNKYLILSLNDGEN